MILRTNSFRRVTIVGVGLIGGSLGLAIKKRKIAREVIGLSHRQSSLVQAMKMKAIDEGFVDVGKAVRNSDLVILATPVEDIVKLFSKINPHLKRGCIVTDVGSTKVEIVEESQKNLGNPSFFVGSHPLAGSDKSGVDHANADLFEKSICVLTPLNSTNQSAVKKVKHFWMKLGCEAKVMKPVDHDEIVSYVSHLPHLLAYSLMETIPDKYLEYASTGLKDTTRIAASSPRLWNDICITNSKHIVKSIDELVTNLSLLRKAIVDRDGKTIHHHFTKAKEKRDGLK